MRPLGDFRVVLGTAAAAFGQQGATRRELAYSACVGLNAARMTVDNMLAAGELVVIGHTREPGVCRPVNRYAVALPCEQQVPPLVRSWAEFD